jgi:hypothetical protein
LNPPALALYVRITVTGVFSGSPGPALQYVGVETIVGELSSELRYFVFKSKGGIRGKYSIECSLS